MPAAQTRLDPFRPQESSPIRNEEFPLSPDSGENVPIVTVARERRAKNAGART